MRGILKIGKDVKISDRASIYNGQAIEIGDNVRIDDFVILSGGSGLKIGSHVHIGAGGYFFAGSGIEIQDFCQFGPGCLVMSESDDFSGESLIGPCVPRKYKPGYKRGRVLLEEHVTLGAKTTVMPGVTMQEGAITGAHALIIKDCDPWTIYAGIPGRPIRARSRNMLDLARLFLDEHNAMAEAFVAWREIHGDQ